MPWCSEAHLQRDCAKARRFVHIAGKVIYSATQVPGYSKANTAMAAMLALDRSRAGSVDLPPDSPMNEFPVSLVFGHLCCGFLRFVCLAVLCVSSQACPFTKQCFNTIKIAEMATSQ